MNAQAIQSAEILVRFANPAEDGKKPNIRASSGEYYGVKPADFGRFQPGGRYRIDYTERVYKGRTYKDIVKCEPVTTPAPSANPTAPAAAGGPCELDFVTRMLAAYVQCCGVENTVDGLVTRGKRLREVYRQVFS